jgi:hypothetical protein
MAPTIGVDPPPRPFPSGPIKRRLKQGRAYILEALLQLQGLLTTVAAACPNVTFSFTFLY